MVPQSARILTTPFPKKAAPLEDCQREYGKVTRSRSRYTGPSSFPPSCTAQRPEFSIGSSLSYWSGSTNAACAPSLLSKGKTTCRTKKSSREPACPACFRVQLRWAGHVTRMEDVCMPKAVSSSELHEGKRERGVPKKRYKNQLKRQLAHAGISNQSWQQASDRDSWHSSVRKASCEFEAEWHEAAKEKRRRQKERAASPSSSTQTFVCPKCSRMCASRIGLYSHQRAFTIMSGQPIKLPENRRDVVSFLTFCDSSGCCILCACKRLICVWGKLARPVLQFCRRLICVWGKPARRLLQ